jgi:type IX secretion system PorP/SprF family membrane protein
MRIKLFISASFCLLLACHTNAQQVFKVAQFVKHNYIYNPAAAGAEDKSSIGVAYRKMWSGMPGGPQTTLLYGDHYFESKKTGVGVVLYSDKTGPTSRTGGQINVSYSLDFDNGKRLMFGLAGMFMQYRIDKSSFSNYIPNDPLLASNGTEMKADASAAVYYKSKTLNIGFSAQQLMQSKLNFIKSSTNTEGKLYRHYYLAGHYNWKTDDENTVVPNFSISYVNGSPVDAEAGVMIEHKNLLWAGLGYHYNQSFTGMAGIKIKKQLSLGYAFQQYRTPISVFDDGGAAHEISLRYFFSK